MPIAIERAIDAVLAPFLPGIDLRPSVVASDVRAVSDLYNGLPASTVPPDRRLAAQLLFFLPADLGKVPFCLSELAAAKALPARRVLRLLDLGAGPGTASLGAAIALAGMVDEIQITAVDRDARALEVGRALHVELSDDDGSSPGAGIRRAVRTVATDLARGRIPDGEFDLVVIQGLLSELPGGAREPLVRAAIGALAPDGAAIVIEPALRTTARALHALRDAIRAGNVAHVFAPCVRQGPCPALDREDDWCHEDREWDPSPRVVEIGRLAGLRRGGLKFAYVTFVRGGASVADSVPGKGTISRVVSDLMRSKGKSEAFFCNDDGRTRVTVLNRNRSEAFDRLRRGDLVRS